MKVGIVTHYYKSKNYGGNLQAYALTSYLSSCGYEAEQICYDPMTSLSQSGGMLQKILKLGISGTVRGVFSRLKSVRANRVVKKEQNQNSADAPC